MSAADTEHPATQAGRTAWARNLAAPVRDFLSTETGSAIVLLGAAIVAPLIWANSPWSDSYESLWTTKLSIRLGGGGIAADLRHWVNEGLMTFFFLVVGLEAKRELDVGELRERRRLAIPVLAAIGGMTVPIAIYLAFNAGGAGADGWGAAMSTDTAFALGALALLTPRSATRLRVFLLTLAVVDDLGALVVIATVYTASVSTVPLLIVAIGLFGRWLALRYAPTWRRQASIVVGVALWVALFKSGIDPVITGLAIGLVTSAYPPSREDLERATALTRSFREQPTPELARSAQLGVLAAISPNERLQYSLHPWTSYVVVPLFALANAGIHVSADLLTRRGLSPITLGIFFGYVVGKPAGHRLGRLMASPRGRAARPGPTVSWPILLAAGGRRRHRLHGLAADLEPRLPRRARSPRPSSACSPRRSWHRWWPGASSAVIKRLPEAVRARQIAQTAEDMLDLADRRRPRSRPHPRAATRRSSRWSSTATSSAPTAGRPRPSCASCSPPSTTTCATCGAICPSTTSTPHAQLAAEAAEAAAAQGRFWEFYDLLFAHQDALDAAGADRA